MRWKSEYRGSQVMNSLTVLMLLTLSSVSLGTGNDFSALDDEYLQYEFIEDEVSDSDSDKDSNQAPSLKSVSVLLADSPQINVEVNLKRKREDDTEGSDSGKGTDTPNKNLNSSLLPARPRIAYDEQLFDQIARQSNGPDSYEDSFQKNSTKSSKIPKRRQIKNWRTPEGYYESKIPWSSEIYTPKVIQADYLESSSYPDSKESSEYPLVMPEDFKDQSTRVKPPQYFQKNYYYNYYPLVEGRKYKSPKWSGEEIYNPENSFKKKENPVGRKSSRPNPCKLYLQFLKYAFDKLDENSDYYYDMNDDYEESEGKKSTRMFGTQLHGPTLYIDNSGKISQVSTNGDSIQIAEGVSPKSRVLIITNDTSKQDFTTIQFPTTGIFNSNQNNDYSLKFTTPQSWPSISTEKNDTEGPTSTTKIQPPPWTVPTENGKLPTTEIDLEESTTVHEFDFNTEPTPFPILTSTTRFREEYSRRMNVPIAKMPFRYNTTAPYAFHHRFSTQNPTTISTFNSNGNKLSAKTTVSFEESTEFEEDSPRDCKDKMLPCPDSINITYPLNGYCNRYVSCESGKAIRRTCPEGLHFNIIIKSCDLPHNSFCTYSCPEPNGYFGIPGDCGGYFVCKNKIPEYRMCPPKMHWDAKKNSCTFLQLSSCPMKCFKDNEIRPYEGDCKAYIVCLNGIPYYHKCPPNMKFEGETLTCVPEDVSSCQDDPKLLTKTLNPSSLCKDVQLKLGAKAWCSFFQTPKNK